MGVMVGIGVIVGIGVTVGRGVGVGVSAGVGAGVAVGRPPNHGKDGIWNGGDGIGGIVGRAVTAWASVFVLMRVWICEPMSTFSDGRI